jgi:hypothetical protein
MPRPPRHDFVIKQAATWDPALYWKDGDQPKNLTGYTARMHIRDKTNGVLIKELTSSSGITITAAEGKVALLISAADTQAFRFKKAVYDLFLIDTAPTPDYAYCALEGEIELIGAATQAVV